MLCIDSTYVSSVVNMFLPFGNYREREMLDQVTSSAATNSEAAPAVVNAQDAEILKLNAEILMLEQELDVKRSRVELLVADKEKKAAEQTTKIAEAEDIELSLKRERCFELFLTLSERMKENAQRVHRIETLEATLKCSESEYNKLVKSEIYNIAFQIGILEGSKNPDSVQKVEVLRRIKAKLETQPENVTSCSSLTVALNKVQSSKQNLESARAEFKAILEQIAQPKNVFRKSLHQDDSNTLDIKLLKALLKVMSNGFLRDFLTFLIREGFFEIAKAVVDCDFGIEDKHKLRCLNHNEFANIVFEQTSSGELETSKVSELSRLLVSLNLFSKRLGFSSSNVMAQKYDGHLYLHLFFAANYNVGQVFQSAFKKGLLEIGVNGATKCDMRFVDQIYNEYSRDITRLIFAFRSNLDNCFGLFWTVHAIQQLPIETPDQLKAVTGEEYRTKFLKEKPEDKYSLVQKAITGHATSNTFITTNTLSEARSYKFTPKKSTPIRIDTKIIEFTLANNATPKLITL